MKKWLFYLGGILSILLLGVGLGPRPEFAPLATVYPEPALSPANVEQFVAEREAAAGPIKAENGARIIWANDSLRQRTPWSIVYLHGFIASQREGDPLHREVAARYGCNLYLARLAQHGLQDRDAFKSLNPQAYVASAAEALAIGRALGDSVLLMSTSTGGTLSIYLAATFPDSVDAMVLYSPNIRIANEQTRLLTYPWGRQLGEWIGGSEYMRSRDVAGQYWYSEYHINGLIALQALIDETMRPEFFARVDQPFLLAYYYKNEQEQDHVVSVPAMRDFYRQTATPAHLRLDRPLATVGDHVLASDLKSADLDAVRATTIEFLENILHWQPLPASTAHPAPAKEITPKGVEQ